MWETKVKLNKRALKGSHTLEAALIMPVILFTVISTMYFVFYMHDRFVMEMCAYKSAVEGIYDDNSEHAIAKTNLRNLNTFTIKPSSTWTEGIVKRKVKYMGRYVAPFTAIRMFINDERVSEDSYAYQRMKIKNMYAIKVVGEMLKKQ